MNCKQAQQAAALLAGDELRDEYPLRMHLLDCEDCRRHHRQVVQAMQVLRSCRAVEEADAAEETPSLWPALAVRLQRTRVRRPAAERFNGWIPAVVTVAACLLVGVYLVRQPLVPQRHYLDGSPMVERPLPFPSEWYSPGGTQQDGALPAGNNWSVGFQPQGWEPEELLSPRDSRLQRFELELRSDAPWHNELKR